MKLELLPNIRIEKKIAIKYANKMRSSEMKKHAKKIHDLEQKDISNANLMGELPSIKGDVVRDASKAISVAMYILILAHENGDKLGSKDVKDILSKPAFYRRFGGKKHKAFKSAKAMFMHMIKVLNDMNESNSDDGNYLLECFNEIIGYDSIINLMIGE